MIEEICLDESKQILARFLKLEIDIVEKALQSLNEKQPYKEIIISKKNGSKRIAFCPKSQELKLVQRAILENIFYKFELEDNFFGFCKNRNIIQNARYHIREEVNYNPQLPIWLLKIDIKDAFPSIDYSMLINLFLDIFAETRLHDGLLISEQNWYFGFIHLLVQLTTYQGVLIQGISTSPYLFNLYIQETVNPDIKGLFVATTITKHFYSTELQYYPFRFSWYADDLIISFMNMETKHGFQKKIINIINSHGLKVNKQKTRLTRVNRFYPFITGVVLNIKKYPTPIGRVYENINQSYKHSQAYAEYINDTVTTRLKSKALKNIRGKIHRVIVIIKSGRLPDREKDGISVNTILGYINLIKYMSRINNKKGSGFMIPPSVKKPMEEFQKLIKEKYLN